MNTRKYTVLNGNIMFDLGNFFRNITVAYSETCLHSSFFGGEHGQSAHMTDKKKYVGFTELHRCTESGTWFV